MRKLLLLIAAAVTMALSPAHAYTEVVNGVEWTYIRTAGESSIVNLSRNAAIPTSTTGAITIPSTLGGCPVTSIGDLAFVACSGLTSVMIPDSVTSIGESAFVACSGLTSVTIPAGVTSIGNYAFAACSGIKSVTIPQVVCSGPLSSIFPSAYQTITNVVVAGGVTSIGDFVFYGCSGLKSVTIPDSVMSVGEGAFNGCNGALFDTEAIPGVKLVDGWAVGYTDDLSGDLDLTGVRGIGDWVFEGCYDITSVTIPDNVTCIGSGAFSECEGLERVTIGGRVTSIGEWAFGYCTQLTSVTIPLSVRNVEEAAFCYCSSLTSVTIPNSVTGIGGDAFNGCSSLTNVIFKGNAPSADDTSFKDVGSGCIASVSRSSTGWGEGEKWHGLTLVYVDGGGDGDELVYEIVDVAVEEDVQGDVSVKRMVVGVVAKDGEQIVQGDPEKVAAMFEATSDLRDWDGAAKLTPEVEVLGTDANGKMTFAVTPGDGTAPSAFLRIRK